VGDSVGMVLLGYDSTLPVTLREMVHHTKAVTRAVKQALVVSDLPFGSYQESPEKAWRSARRLIQEGGADAVKLEGGEAVVDQVKQLVKKGIPVMGHLGMTPQSVTQLGGYKVQGKEKEEREAILQDALAVEEGGAFSVVLEGIPLDLAQEITRRLSIPTIGIGAGIHCDGQVLVVHDMLGLFDIYTPKFVKQYVDLKGVMTDAVKNFIAEVREGKFPDEDHSFH